MFISADDAGARVGALSAVSAFTIDSKDWSTASELICTSKEATTIVVETEYTQP
jgi:hypothetical protein